MAGGGGDQMCAVCLSKFDDEDAIRLLPECKHCFHVKCIDKWLLLHSTCPVCRVKTIIMTGEHEKVKGTSPAVNRHGEGDNVGGGHWTARWFWWVAAEAEDVVFEI